MMSPKNNVTSTHFGYTADKFSIENHKIDAAHIDVKPTFRQCFLLQGTELLSRVNA